MRNKSIAGFVVAGLCACAIAEEPPMQKTPSIENILAAMPLHKAEAAPRRLEALRPYFDLLSLLDVRRALAAGAVFEAKHPEQDWGSAHYEEKKYKENEAYFYLVVHVLYWWCNVREKIPPADQVKFMSKQSQILQHMWIDIVAQTKLDASRALGIECLRQNLAGGEISASFGQNHEWWGEPAKLIDVAESATWEYGPREAVVSIATHSKDDAFKQKVVELFSKDKNEYVRISLESYIKKGLLPAVGEPKKDKGK